MPYFLQDGGQVECGPIQAKAQVATRQRAFNDNKVGQAVEARSFAQKQLQCTHRRDDDAQFGVAETRVIGHQGKRTEVQAGTERDAVDASVECRIQAHLQGFARTVHGQLFHAVDENHAVAPLGFHGLADVQLGGLRQVTQIELNHAFVGIADVVLVELGLFLDELGVEAAVGHVLHHGVGNVPNAAQSCRLECQLGGGNIHAHSADDEWYQFPVTKMQAEIVKSFHCNLKNRHLSGMGRRCKKGRTGHKT